MTAHPCLPLDVAAAHVKLGRLMAATFPAVPAHVREELAQEAWARLLEQAQIADPAGWLFVAARRLAIDWFRRQSRRGGAGVPLDANLPGPTLDLLVRLDGTRLVRLLDRAPEHHRRVLERLYLHEGELAELAVDLGVSADSVYKRRDRALAWLRAAVEHRDAPSKPEPPRKLSRKAQILEHLRAQGGWCNTMALRGALLPVLGGSRDRLSGELIALRREGRIEVRGARKRAEYRLAPTGSAP